MKIDRDSQRFFVASTTNAIRMTYGRREFLRRSSYLAADKLISNLVGKLSLHGGVAREEELGDLGKEVALP